MANRVYVTVEGDALDAIAAREMGSEAAVDAIFAMNPHLSKYDGPLPHGVKVILPERYEKDARVEVRLWD